MTEVLSIKYEGTGKVTYVLPNQNYQVGDCLVIKNKKGSRLAQAVTTNEEIDEVKLPAEMDKVLRLANEKDLQAYQENLELAKNSFDKVNELIEANNLKMKVIDIVFPLERSYVLITFCAEDRVDFRQLLRDLASYFKTRIELRQINSREEAKVYGGVGPCGRALCCASFLGEFPPVSIKMVKNQGMSLSTGKTAGICGRLMCCLSFEDEFYKTSKEKFPDLGTEIETVDGLGVVAGIDVFSDTVKVRLPERHTLLTYALEEVKVRG
ncbi:Cell fate regulator YaaT, PSP1 superfamily (controls sporulation, competence, biofilm development) [Streptococcus equinus]|uniref:PSP1 domain-containing protein n=1 Tax=Streptococcus equinus TaxID=1335 RepID=UPI0008D0643B|nr:regulatory iron-sulfur-containing complex subunit RicT [Streptococcus equinus]SEK21763.1 Cell fate regulator YaaT, PSP1 superfamily (controls sporulation, competence, biofilm development) [Streptococcus equinus]